MKLIAEPDYRAKVLFLSFEGPCVIQSSEDVRSLQSQWLDLLKSWHSPYKALLDCTNLTIALGGDDLSKDFERLKKLLKRFFLKNAVSYGLEDSSETKCFPFDHYKTREEAVEALGIRDFTRRLQDKDDLRSLIQLDNHFKDQTIELSFASVVTLKEKKDLKILKSKLLNNLMLWHSGWNLLVDCSRLEIDSSLFEEFSLIQKYFKGFFLKKIVGYNPQSKDLSYPFQVYRSRHKAVLGFEDVGKGKGDLANCSSRK